eukprot:89734-Hanusia_phi.AAC.3
MSKFGRHAYHKMSDQVVGTLPPHCWIVSRMLEPAGEHIIETSHQHFVPLLRVDLILPVSSEPTAPRNRVH